jgi:hypothetical protein
MPAQPDPPLDVRHWDLAEKLRSAPPSARPELRQRVLALAAAEPAVHRRRRPRLRPALVLAPAVLLVAVVGVVGLRSVNVGDSGTQATATGALEGEGVRSVDTARERAPRAVEALRPATSGEAFAGGNRSGRTWDAATLPPGRRLQRYGAELRVNVRDLDELGEATRQAMRTTRGLGGYVVVADYGAPTSEDGESLLVVRVPIARVQDAIFRFSQLGTILSQQVRIQDLQAGFNRTEERIRSLRRSIADVERRLAAPDLTPEERANLRFRRLDLRQSLTAQLRARESTLREGSLARISLTLTTREGAEPVPSRPGYFERTLRDAFSVVGKAIAWTLYVLVVAAPFLALALLVALAERARRRRADERLLERAPAA